MKVPFVLSFVLKIVDQLPLFAHLVAKLSFPAHLLNKSLFMINIEFWARLVVVRCAAALRRRVVFVVHEVVLALRLVASVVLLLLEVVCVGRGVLCLPLVLVIESHCEAKHKQDEGEQNDPLQHADHADANRRCSRSPARLP